MFGLTELNICLMSAKFQQLHRCAAWFLWGRGFSAEEPQSRGGEKEPQLSVLTGPLRLQFTPANWDVNLAYWGCAGESELDVRGRACRWHTGLVHQAGLRRAAAATSPVSLSCRRRDSRSSRGHSSTELRSSGSHQPLQRGALLLVLLCFVLFS